jgi:hypothetical protein
VLTASVGQHSSIILLIDLTEYKDRSGNSIQPFTSRSTSFSFKFADFMSRQYRDLFFLSRQYRDYKLAYNLYAIVSIRLYANL